MEMEQGMTVQRSIDELLAVVSNQPAAARVPVTVQYRRPEEATVIVYCQRGEVVGVRIDAPSD